MADLYKGPVGRRGKTSVNARIAQSKAKQKKTVTNKEPKGRKKTEKEEVVVEHNEENIKSQNPRIFN